MAFSFVGSLVKHSLRHLGDQVFGFGILPVGSIATDVWADWFRSKPGGPPNPAELRQELQKVAQDPAAFQREVEERLSSTPASSANLAHQSVQLFLAQIPGKVQASLKRSDDPTGRTVPTDLPLRKAEDLLPFLPDRMPRFRPGDLAVPGTDLVVERLLGVGGFGEVWMAFHKSRPHARPVALKFCTDEAAARTLRKEVELLDRVARQGRHKGIVELIYAHLEGDTPCLEYEYLDGGDLGGLAMQIHAAGKASPDLVGRLVFGLGEAVGHAHRLRPPIVHRDLKPANILTTRIDGKVVVKVADFGIGGIASTQAVKDWAANTQGATMSAGSCTPLYASPQQRHFGAPDPRDDVYALGVIWFQLLTGDLTSEPPRGGSWKKRIRDRGASGPMVELLERCIEDDPNDRPADAQCLADELRALLAPVAPPPPPPVPPPPPMPSEEWFYSLNGAQAGPVTLATLREMALARKLKPDDLVWTEKLGGWKPAGSLAGLCPAAPPALVGRARGRIFLKGQFHGGLMPITLKLDDEKLGSFLLMAGCDLPFEVPSGEHRLEVNYSLLWNKGYSFILEPGSYKITLKYQTGMFVSGFAENLEIERVPGSR